MLLLGLLFVCVGSLIALIRLRTSPLYPHFNDVNSDVYVFQMVGNSWRYGYLPYRDVYDVKGPFLYLLFGMFAWIRPWSFGPPLLALAALASCSTGLAYAISRRYLTSRPVAATAAVAAVGVIYLGVADVNSSFTCEELAVPGVLLMLWLFVRWLQTGVEVPTAWCIVNGAYLGAMFWTKYTGSAPWAAVFVGLVVVAIRGRLAARALRRLALWTLVGFAAATALILPFFAAVLGDLAGAYFLGKRGNFQPAGEFPAQAAWVVRTVTENTGVSLVLAAAFAVLLTAAIRGRGSRHPLPLVLVIGFVVSLYASGVIVRHPNHLYLPLTFCTVALAQALSAFLARPSVGRTLKSGTRLKRASVIVYVGVGVGTAVLLAYPIAEAVAKMWLLGRPKAMTCHDLVSGDTTTRRVQVSTVFAQAADNQPIMSIGTLFAARTSFISRQPMRHEFEFVDNSWKHTIGADDVQTSYLENRTLRYVWIHVDTLEPLRSPGVRLTQANLTSSKVSREQAAALSRNYRPILGCNKELLLRAS